MIGGKICLAGDLLEELPEDLRSNRSLSPNSHQLSLSLSWASTDEDEIEAFIGRIRHRVVKVQVIACCIGQKTDFLRAAITEGLSSDEIFDLACLSTGPGVIVLGWDSMAEPGDVKAEARDRRTCSIPLNLTLAAKLN